MDERSKCILICLKIVNDPFPDFQPHKVRTRSVSTPRSNQEGRGFSFKCQCCKHVKSGKYLRGKQPCVKFTELVMKGLQLQTCRLPTSMKAPDVETRKRGFRLGFPAVAPRTWPASVLTASFPPGKGAATS